MNAGNEILLRGAKLGYHSPVIKEIGITLEEVEMLAKTGISLLRSTVPDSMREALHSIADQRRADQWALGDIALGLIAFVDSNRMVVREYEIYEFLAQELNNELSARTIRHYARICKEFPLDPTNDGERIGIPSGYSKVIPHSHFAFAVTLPDYAGEIVEESVRFYVANGYTCTKDYLEKKFTQEASSIPPDEQNPPIAELNNTSVQNYTGEVAPVQPAPIPHVWEEIGVAPKLGTIEIDGEGEMSERETAYHNRMIIQACLKALKALMQYAEKFLDDNRRNRVVRLIEPLVDELNSI